MITFRNTYKFYGDWPALRNINLQIDSGEFIYLIGESGAGKTTLLRLINAYDFPTSGEVIVGGMITSKLRDSQIPKLRRRVGVVYQDFKLLRYRTVRENLAFALEAVGRKKRDIPRHVERVLTAVGLPHVNGRFPHQLSGGEQQRVTIARALISEPEVILADEPTGNLDANNAYQVMHILEEVNNREGTAIILATHNSQLLRQFPHRTVKLHKGEIQQEDKT
jgi:cell division transport system ATP-binding protein